MIPRSLAESLRLVDDATSHDDGIGRVDTGISFRFTEVPHAHGGPCSTDRRATDRTDGTLGTRGPDRATASALPDSQRRRFPSLRRADAGPTDAPLAAVTGAGRATVERLRDRFVRAGREAARTDPPRSAAPAQRDGKPAAMIVALARSNVPEGQARARWTARLRAHRAVAWEVVESLSESTVRRLLPKPRGSPGRSGRGPFDGRRRGRRGAGGGAGVVRGAPGRNPAGGGQGRTVQGTAWSSGRTDPARAGARRDGG
jgi:Homeodomain-like domain